MIIVRKALVTLLLLSPPSWAVELSGAWNVVEWSAGNPHTEIVTMVFEKDGTLRTVTALPGMEPVLELSKYEVIAQDLVITRSSGEVSRHPLEVQGVRVKVGVPFGYFVLEGAPNNSLQARLP